mgnify:CR=1 FL=1
MYENGLFLGGVFLTPQNGRFWGKSKNPKKCTVGVQILPFFGVMAILTKNGQKHGHRPGRFWTPIFRGTPLLLSFLGDHSRNRRSLRSLETVTGFFDPKIGIFGKNPVTVYKSAVFRVLRDLAQARFTRPARNSKPSKRHFYSLVTTPLARPLGASHLAPRIPSAYALVWSESF